MVSSKERLRLERQWDEMNVRMQRQYAAITRIAALNTHLMATLLEIASAEAPNDQPDLLIAKAQAALDVAEQMSEAASGNDEDQQESST